MADESSTEHDELVYAAAGLPKTTNWWGAFVIGLAGTILVTGIAPVMVTELGASSVPVIVFITLTGYVVCLLLAELSAMMPDRAAHEHNGDRARDVEPHRAVRDAVLVGVLEEPRELPVC